MPDPQLRDGLLADVQDEDDEPYEEDPDLAYDAWRERRHFGD